MKIRWLLPFTLLPLLGAAPAPKAPVVAKMHKRYAQTEVARDAVAWGDLEGAKAAGAELSGKSKPGFKDPERVGLDNAMRDRAQALSQAKDLPEAAETLANMAITCGACHDLHSGGPPTEEVLDQVREQPPESWMAAESRGLTLLWLGLTAPSDEAWATGVSLLEREPEAETPNPPIDRAGLVAQAEAAEDEKSKARVYAAMLLAFGEHTREEK